MKNLITLTLLLVSITVFSQTQDSPTYFFQKGIEEKTENRHLAAAGYFEKAIQLDPNYTAAYLENGYSNLEMRKTDAAMQNFTKVHELDPGNDAAIKQLVELYFNYHQYQRAIDFAKKCKGCENMDRIIAMSYFQMEDYKNAEKLLLGLLEKDPKDAEATYTLARTYLEMGFEAKAIPAYIKAVELDETKSQWSFELGLLYYNNDNYKNAVVYFTKAAAQGFVQTNDFKENLGFSYIYSRDFENGEKILSDIVARRPGDKDLLRDIADAYYQGKMYDKSLEYCQKLMEIDMKDGKALYQAGLCFQKKGQVRKGQAMCDKAIELDPSLNGLRQKNMTMGM